MNRDRITIDGLEVWARIGVTAGERAAPQRLEITLVLGLELTAAGASDALSDTVDYAAVAEESKRVAAEREWSLIEALASEIASRVLGRFQVARVAVEVRKFILPDTRHVAVRIERSRRAPGPAA